MSAPTKGMVAGRPIQTGTVTEEYESGFDRTFGERKKERGRWVYTAEGPVRVGEDWTPADRQAPRRSEEEVYGRVAATDGTDLSTRRRHREYMKANGLAMHSDYTETWEKAKKQRDNIAAGGKFDTERRREAVARAMYEVKNRRRKP